MRELKALIGKLGLEQGNRSTEVIVWIEGKSRVVDKQDLIWELSGLEETTEQVVERVKVDRWVESDYPRPDRCLETERK